MTIKYQNKKRGSAKIFSLALTVVVVLICAAGVTYAVKYYLKDKEGNVEPARKMELSEALEIAKDSECTEQGSLTDRSMYNEFTKTWWIDLEIDKPGCAPACVVQELDKTAEINWRCTGLIPE